MKVEPIGTAYRVEEDDGTESLYVQISDTKYIQFMWSMDVNKVPMYYEVVK